ncbi:MAG TPA: hypothetical protein VKV40_24025 [Ktedonobacteraceae bacterium]|nr:hypothetical protein [Ktedonobacteraceae bacterium]
MQGLDVPDDVRRVLREYYTCEVTTVNSKGQPITWPSLPYYDERMGQIVLSVSIAFPVKAFNVRRHRQLSLLYSDPTGSGLEQAPAVLIQGEGTVSELVDFESPRIRGLFQVTSRRQPDVRRFTSNRFVRRLFAWYLFQRLVITVQPRRILVWPHRDFSVEPTEIEVTHVE